MRTAPAAAVSCTARRKFSAGQCACAHCFSDKAPNCLFGAFYIRRCFEWRTKSGCGGRFIWQNGGIGQVNPNPLVGAVIVRDGRTLGEGWHERYGGPHAERNALGHCAGSPEGATLYVNLEPCCHTGRNPPCTDAILESGIRRSSSAPSTRIRWWAGPRNLPSAGKGNRGRDRNSQRRK